MRKLLSSRTLVIFVFLTFAVSVIYVSVRLIMAPSVPVDGETVRVKGDYVLMLLQCILGVAAMLLPGILQRKLRLNIPSGMVIAFAIYLYCAIYLGEVFAFFYRVPHWDTLLHTFSGAAFCIIGMSIIGILSRAESVSVSLSPAFIAIFALCFSLAVGSIWEIYEYAMDVMLGTNMQKFALEGGAALVGQAALADTMKDLIVDTLGAAVAAVAGYVSMKRTSGWADKIQLRVLPKVPADGEAAAAEEEKKISA